MTDASTPGQRDTTIGRYSGLARTALAGGALSGCGPDDVAEDGFGAAAYAGLARRVGPAGIAYGVDGSADMVELAGANAARARACNVRFLVGHIEDIPLPDGHVDVVISNCVVNLSGDKPRVLAEAFRHERDADTRGVRGSADARRLRRGHDHRDQRCGLRAALGDRPGRQARVPET